MKITLNRSKTGDTLVEVILAMALISMVLFSSWALTNRSTQLTVAAQRRISVVDQLKQQVELLKNKRNTDPTNFSALFSGHTTNIPSPANACTDDSTLTVTTTPRFYLSVNALGDVVLTPMQKTVDNNSQLWVQARPSSVIPSAFGSFIDFYVSGCWRTSGGHQNLDNSQLFIRLNT